MIEIPSPLKAARPLLQLPLLPFLFEKVAPTYFSPSYLLLIGLSPGGIEWMNEE